MNAQELIDTARALVAGDKGLLAMEESNPTCNKRFARLGIPQTEEARRVGSTASSVSSSQVQPGGAPWRIQCRDGKDMNLTTSVPQPTKPAA
jgi:hypothetical protein